MCENTLQRTRVISTEFCPNYLFPLTTKVREICRKIFSTLSVEINIILPETFLTVFNWKLKKVILRLIFWLSIFGQYSVKINFCQKKPVEISRFSSHDNIPHSRETIRMQTYKEINIPMFFIMNSFSIIYTLQILINAIFILDPTNLIYSLSASGGASHKL